MTVSDRTQAPGLAKDPVSWSALSPLPALVLKSSCWTFTGAVTWSGGSRCGRMKFGIRTWIATKATRVTAIAGRVRRSSTPTVTPSAKASAA